MDDFRKEAIERRRDKVAELWESTHHNISAISRYLKVSRGTVYADLRARGIEPTEDDTDTALVIPSLPPARVPSPLEERLHMLERRVAVLEGRTFPLTITPDLPYSAAPVITWSGTWSDVKITPESGTYGQAQ